MSEEYQSITSIITNGGWNISMEIKLRYLNFLYLLFLTRKMQNISAMIQIINGSFHGNSEDISLDILFVGNEMYFNKNDVQSPIDMVLPHAIYCSKLLNLAIEKKLYPVITQDEHAMILQEIQKSDFIIDTNFAKLTLFFKQCVGGVERNETKYYCIGDVCQIDSVLGGVIYGPGNGQNGTFYYQCNEDCFKDCYDKSFGELTGWGNKPRNETVNQQNQFEIDERLPKHTELNADGLVDLYLNVIEKRYE